MKFSSVASRLPREDFSLKDFGLVNLGTLLVAIGVYFFRLPNNFSTGGVTGIAIIFSSFIPVPKSAIVWFMNILLIFLGFFLVNGAFGIKTVYSSLLFSALLSLFEKLVPLAKPLTDQPFLELIYAMMIPALGSAILFNCRASTGGSDITAMILKKYLHTNIGRALMYVDSIVAISSIFVFNIQTGLYSIMGLIMKAFLVDSILESFNICKYFNIVTSQPDLVTEYVTKTLNRSATEVHGIGCFTHADRSILLVVLTRPQAIRLQLFLKQHDPGAFVTVLNTSNIIGKGFRDNM